MLLSTKKDQGFTLIELSIVLIIIGVLLTMYLNIYKLWSESKDFYTVETNLDNALQAINNFRASGNQRYPCPADPNLTPADANFGREDCSLTVQPGQNAASDGVLVGMLPIYVYNNSDGSVDLSPENFVLLRSFVSNQYSYSSDISDPWNEHFIYAVTDNLTDISTFNTNLNVEYGSIKITDEFGNNTGGTNNNAHYAVASLGKDARCDIGRNIAERENCDNDSVFTAGILSTSDNLTNYYDDRIKFKRNEQSGIWRNLLSPSLTKVNDVTKMPELDGVVFIGDSAQYDQSAWNDTSPADPNNIRLDVAGNILSEDKVGARQICTNSGTIDEQCFQPESLFNLTCENTNPSDPPRYMRGVSLDRNGRLVPDCGPIEFANINQDCPVINGVRGYVQAIFTNGSGLRCERR